MAERKDELFGIDRRKAIFTGAAALALAVAAVVGIGQITSLHHIVRALGRGNHAWFPVCLAGALLAYAGYVGAYRDVARFDGGPILGAWTTLKIVVIGFGAVLIGSSAGTLSIDYWALHRAGEPRQRAIRRVLAVGSLQWFVLAILACIAAGVTLAGPWPAPLAMEVAWLVVVPVCIVLAAWVSSPRRSDRLTSPPPGEVDVGRNPRTWARWLGHAGRAVLANSVGGVVIVRRLLRNPFAHPAALLGFPLYWAGDVLILYAALRAFGVHPHPVPLVLAYATGFAITALPLPAGGSGGVEAGLTFALNSIGIAVAPALLATLVYRAFTLWLPVFPAVALLPQVRSLDRELPFVPRAAATPP
jgi:putative heme transporter